MEMTAYQFPGAPRKAYLPAWINVSIRPVDHPRVRSYQKVTGKRYSTVHDTGNPRTNAEGEYAWLAGGRQGGEVGGYEWINDDRVLIVTGYFDEVTWAQGTPEGNRVSDAGELAFGGNVVWNDALEICCAMHGAVIEMRGLNPNDAAVLHQFWYGKYCAAQILNRGIWSTVKAKIAAYATAAAQARAGGVTVPPPSVYADPVPPLVDGQPWDGHADVTINGVVFEAQKLTAATTAALNRRQWASTQSQLTGAVIPAGTDVDLLGWVAGELVDGISEWWIDTAGNRLWAGGIDATPKTVPDYGELPEAVPGMVLVNGRTYYPMHAEDGSGAIGRTITVRRDGTLHKWAGTDSEVVGTVKAGDDRVFRYWTRGEGLPLYDGGPSEIIWYAEDVYSGARMWSGLSDERPD